MLNEKSQTYLSTVSQLRTHDLSWPTCHCQTKYSQPAFTSRQHNREPLVDTKSPWPHLSSSPYTLASRRPRRPLQKLKSSTSLVGPRQAQIHPTRRLSAARWPTTGRPHGDLLRTPRHTAAPGAGPDAPPHHTAPPGDGRSHRTAPLGGGRPHPQCP